jgi:hypothetical protein
MALAAALHVAAAYAAAVAPAVSPAPAAYMYAAAAPAMQCTVGGMAGGDVHAGNYTISEATAYCFNSTKCKGFTTQVPAATACSATTPLQFHFKDAWGVDRMNDDAKWSSWTAEAPASTGGGYVCNAQEQCVKGTGHVSYTSRTCFGLCANPPSTTASPTPSGAAGLAPKEPKLHALSSADVLQARHELQQGGTSTSATSLRSSYELVMEQAEQNAKAGKVWSVMTKNITIPGVSPHNYISIGIYNHPCNAQPPGCKPYPGGHALPMSECDTKTGLPWVPCDGIRNPEAIASGDSPSQSEMVNAVTTAALAAFYSANDSAVANRHIAYGADVLRTWFINNATQMLPNLFYGQIQPHKTPPHASHGGFIEWAHTAMFLDHITLLRFAAEEQNSAAWTKADDSALANWWVQFQSYVESDSAQGERRMTNNHGSW